MRCKNPISDRRKCKRGSNKRGKSRVHHTVVDELAAEEGLCNEISNDNGEMTKKKWILGDGHGHSSKISFEYSSFTKDTRAGHGAENTRLVYYIKNCHVSSGNGCAAIDVSPVSLTNIYIILNGATAAVVIGYCHGMTRFPPSLPPRTATIAADFLFSFG